MRILYRTWQFWKTVKGAPAAGDLVEARQVLSTAQMDLFLRMQPSEQAHALRIFSQILKSGETHPDLLSAALLHDVGKSRFPLNVWERIFIVLGKAFFPERSKVWGQGAPRGWRRPFVVAAQHPNWGAEMAARAGTAPLAVEIIRRHQEHPSGTFQTVGDRLLYQLQILDDRN